MMSDPGLPQQILFGQYSNLKQNVLFFLPDQSNAYTS